MDTANISLAAIRGIQAGREYYVTMVPMDLLPRIFMFDEEPLPAEIRSQRVINKSRVPVISRYITENPENYLFSSITASIDGDVMFEPLAEQGLGYKMGTLTIPLSARFVINDGQHRRAAVEHALKEKPELRFETISVVFFLDGGLKKSQQMFADLNQHVVRPTRSLGILYDHRNEISKLTVALADTVPVFKGHIEKAKTTIPNRSNKLFTLSVLFQATKAVLNKKTNSKSVTDEEMKLAREFWIEVIKHMPEWQWVAEKKVTCAELRKDYVHVHGVVLHAIGYAGGALLEQYPNEWKERLARLEEIDWARSNRENWQGRAIQGGYVSKARVNQVLTTNFIKKVLGLELTKAEQKTENEFLGV